MLERQFTLDLRFLQKRNHRALGGNSSTEKARSLYKHFYTVEFIYFLKFIYFWLRWVFIAAHGLSLVAVSGGYSSLRCTGFSLQWLLLLWSTGSRRTGFSSCGTWAQQLWLAGSKRRLSSSGARAQLLCGMWDLPGPGLEPMSPTLAGGFLTIAPPGKSLEFIF